MRATEPVEPTAVLDHVNRHADVIVPLGNGEPFTLMEVLD